MLLENERYNRALKAAAKLKVVSPGSSNLAQTLLEEQYVTQLALSELGMNVEELLCNLPSINTLLIPNKEPPKKRLDLPLLIEVAGTPKSGKTTLITYAQKSFDIFPISERAAFVKRRTQQKLGKHWTYQAMEETKHLITVATSLMLSKLEKGHRAVVADRDMVDNLIFGRAYFVDGRLIPSTFSSNYHGDERIYSEPVGGLEEVSTRPNHLYALILCLTTPKISLKREGFRFRPGRVMNKNFLGTLYEQYLRFHYQALKLNRNFPYACLDLSGKNLQENKKLFDSMISGILDYYKK